MNRDWKRVEGWSNWRPLPLGDGLYQIVRFGEMVGGGRAKWRYGGPPVRSFEAANFIAYSLNVASRDESRERLAAE